MIRRIVKTTLQTYRRRYGTDYDYQLSYMEADIVGPQRKALQSAFSDRNIGRDERLRMLSYAVGRQLSSANDLTFAELKVILYLIFKRDIFFSGIESESEMTHE